MAKEHKDRRRRNEQEREEEVRRLHAWGRIVLETFRELSPDSAVSFEGMMRGLDNAAQKGNLKGLRMAERDLLEMIHLMPSQLRVRVDQALRSRLGTAVSEQITNLESQVEAIVARGGIENEDEYRLVKSWLDLPTNRPRTEAEVARVQKLLEDYLPVA
jgi:hypothetical protein